MPDLHGWITHQIDTAERSLRAVDKEHDPDWSTQWNANSDTFDIHDDHAALVAANALPAAAGHIAAHDPAAMLRRCEADRRILARHRLDPDAVWYQAAMCAGCGTYGEYDYPETENLGDCPELLDLGHAHGLTDEILAGLDRPQNGERPEPGPGFGMPDALVEGMHERLWVSIIDARAVEPRPEAKALEILGPELKTIPLYVPVAEDPPAT
ncbi:DUF6221 family protein [Streptomyces sp. SAS_275]|uniref:DUF6221 family protein n=1 Tax=Streptomyces sp. SAS_275 TaxID=3412746 RepID=UPI00403D1C15